MSELPMYPRHFGVTFREQSDFDELYQLCQQRDVPLFATSVCASKAGSRSIRRSSRVTRLTISRVQALQRPSHDVLSG